MTDAVVYGRLIRCAHTHYEGCETCGCESWIKAPSDSEVSLEGSDRQNTNVDDSDIEVKTDDSLINVTISRNEAVWWSRTDPRTGNFFDRRVAEACRAALEEKR